MVSKGNHPQMAQEFRVVKYSKIYQWMIWLGVALLPIGSMYAIYGNIYHQYTPNVSIYTIHGSYGLYKRVTSKSTRNLWGFSPKNRATQDGFSSGTGVVVLAGRNIGDPQ